MKGRLMKVYEIFFNNGKSYIINADCCVLYNGRIYFYIEKCYTKTEIAVFDEHSIIGFIVKELNL